MIYMTAHPEIDSMTKYPARGVYHHYHHREMTMYGEVDVDFIMLDVRYHRTKADMLGSAQWEWLQRVLQKIKNEPVKPNWIVIVLGTTYLLEHPAIVKKVGGESWDNESRMRFSWLLQNLKFPRERIILLSGDVHFSIVHDFQGLKVMYFLR